MSRHNSAPTHGWVIGSQINKILATLFVLSLIVNLIIIFTIRGVVQHNCQDYYTRTLGVPNHWIRVEVGSTKDGCPQPYKHDR